MLSVTVSGTCSDLCVSFMFPSYGSATRLPPSLLPGSDRTRSPSFNRYYEAATTTGRIWRHSVCKRCAAIPRVDFQFSLAVAGKSPRRRQGVVQPVSPSRFRCSSQGRLRFSQVPREPHCAYALLLDSAGALMPSLRGISVLPPNRQTRRASGI